MSEGAYVIIQVALREEEWSPEEVVIISNPAKSVKNFILKGLLTKSEAVSPN